MDSSRIYVVCSEWISERTGKPVTTVEVAFHSLAEARAHVEYAQALMGETEESPTFRFYVSAIELFENRQEAE